MCFEKGKPPRDYSTKAWGAEYGFYGDIDPGWDESESDDARLLDRIRKNGLNEADSQLVPGIVTRLGLRTKCAQETLLAKAETARLILLRFHKTDTDGERTRSSLLSRIEGRASHIVEQARAVLKEEKGREPTTEEIEAQLRRFAEATRQIPAEFPVQTTNESAE